MHRITSLLIMLACCVAAAGAAFTTGAADAATPTPTATATPTPDPALATVHVRVVDDVNENGVEDAGERGIAGAQLYAGCADGRVPAATDTNGDASIALGVAPGLSECVSLVRKFGWLPIGPLSVRVPQEPGLHEVAFYVHDYGNSVMEVAGEAIVNGLAAPDAVFDLNAPPYTGEGAGCVRPFSAFTLMILGADMRAGCPGPGDQFSVVMNGAVVGTFTFAAGGREATTFAIGPDSMRLYAFDIDDVWVFDTGSARLTRGCAVIQPASLVFGPPDYVRIIVLPDEVRPGCGAPGRRVGLVRDGVRLVPDLPWQPGEYRPSPPVEFKQPDIVVRAPDTGSGGAPRASAAPATALATLIAGCSALFAAALVLRVRCR